MTCKQHKWLGVQSNEASLQKHYGTDMMCRSFNFWVCISPQILTKNLRQSASTTEEKYRIRCQSATQISTHIISFFFLILLGTNTLVTEQDPRQSVSANFITEKDLHPSASAKKCCGSASVDWRVRSPHISAMETRR